MSTSSVRRSRLLIPISCRAELERGLELALVVDLDQRGQAQLGGQRMELGELAGG